MDLKALEDIRNGLAKLSSAQGNAVVRQGLRKAVRPPRRALKAAVAVLRRSPQSSGATERAVQEFVRYPGNHRNVGGFKIGVALGYEETSFRTNRFLHRMTRSKAKNFRRHTAIVNLGVNPGRGKRIVRKFVRSRQKTGLRGRGKQVNKPKKYWHLIHHGFQHKSGKNVPGYYWVPKVEESHGDESAEILVKHIRDNLP